MLLSARHESFAGHDTSTVLYVSSIPIPVCQLLVPSIGLRVIKTSIFNHDFNIYEVHLI